MNKNISFQKQLQNFQRYQAILAENLKETEDDIDLFDISRSFIIFDDDAKLTIQAIPFEGDFVYLSYFNSEKQLTDRMPFNLSFFSQDIIDELIERMRKCMIITELRADTAGLEEKNNHRNNPTT